MVNPAYGEWESYTTQLPTKFNASAFFKATEWLKVGAIFHGELDLEALKAQRHSGLEYNPFRCRTSLMATLSVGDWLELMGSAAIVADGRSVSWFNPGAGVSVSLFRGLQVYAMLDYISNIYLVDAKAFSVSAGINLRVANDRFRWRRQKEQ